MIELVPEEDCIYGTGDVRHGHKIYNITNYNNRIRGRKHCFICGTKDERKCCWVEYYNYYRIIRQYLCDICRDNNKMEK